MHPKLRSAHFIAELWLHLVFLDSTCSTVAAAAAAAASFSSKLWPYSFTRALSTGYNLGVEKTSLRVETPHECSRTCQMLTSCETASVNESVQMVVSVMWVNSSCEWSRLWCVYRWQSLHKVYERPYRGCQITLIWQMVELAIGVSVT